LTSLGMQQQGEQNLSGAIARTPQAPLFNPASFFVNPEQQQQAESAASLYGAAPNPMAAAQAAMQAARAGGSGGYPGRGGFGGGGYGGSAGPVSPSSYVRGPWASDQMGVTVGGAMGSPQGPQEASPAGYQRWQDWASSLPGMDPYAGLSGSFDDYMQSMGMGESGDPYAGLSGSFGDYAESMGLGDMME